MQTPIVSNSALWTGRILSSLVVLLMMMDGIGKLVKPAPVLEATTKLGMPLDTVTPIGILLLAITALYAFRSTAILGAVLLSGFLGGACAINLRAETPIFNVAFPVIFGALAWAGIFVREPRLFNLFYRKPEVA